jgi:hypothetical protein
MTPTAPEMVAGGGNEGVVELGAAEDRPVTKSKGIIHNNASSLGSISAARVIM